MLASDIESILTVSPVQAAQLSPEFGEIPMTSCTQLILDLQGGLDPRALSASCQEMVRRFPVLRTSLVWKSVERPMRIIHRSSEFRVFSHDLSKLPLERRPNEIKALLEGDRTTAFDRAAPPLARLTLLKLDANSFRLLFSYDPIVMDAWSASFIMRELLNGGHDSGSRNGYESYLSWISRQDETAVEAYWRNALSSFRPPASNHLAWGGRGTASSTVVSTLSALRIRALPDTLSAALCRTAKEQRLSFGVIVWAAWALYLS